MRKLRLLLVDDNSQFLKAARDIWTVREVLKISAILCALFVPGLAQALQPGTYRCYSYNVSGGGGGNCRIAPPIVINTDGTYRESSTSGTYRIDGNLIRLSQSTIRGPGKLSGGNQITFEYDYKGWRHTVTYLCQDCNSASVTPSGSAAVAAGTAPVRAEVRLQFPRSDGFLGWVNAAYLIPREHAAAFAASPLRPSNPPPGAVWGSAGRSDPQAVSTLFKLARAEVWTMWCSWSRPVSGSQWRACGCRRQPCRNR